MKMKERKVRNIVLCGSMKVKEKIIEVAKELEKMGYNVLLPVECMQGLEKVIASRAHFDRISNPENDTILIVNETKNGIENYIGPNSFAEIAFGFYFNKRVFFEAFSRSFCLVKSFASEIFSSSRDF